MPQTLPTEYLCDGHLVRIDLAQRADGRWEWAVRIGSATRFSPPAGAGNLTRNAAVLEAMSEAEWRIKWVMAPTTQPA